MWRGSGRCALLFDGASRVGPVGKLQRVSVNDRVVGEPERWSSRREQNKFRQAATQRLTISLRLYNYGDCGDAHCRREQPSVVACEAGGRKTEAAPHQRGRPGVRRVLVLIMHELAEIH